MIILNFNSFQIILENSIQNEFFNNYHKIKNSGFFLYIPREKEFSFLNKENGRKIIKMQTIIDSSIFFSQNNFVNFPEMQLVIEYINTFNEITQVIFFFFNFYKVKIVFSLSCKSRKISYEHWVNIFLFLVINNLVEFNLFIVDRYLYFNL